MEITEGIRRVLLGHVGVTGKEWAKRRGTKTTTRALGTFSPFFR
jgi:hypothetical protein